MNNWKKSQHFMAHNQGTFLKTSESNVLAVLVGILYNKVILLTIMIFYKYYYSKK